MTEVFNGSGCFPFLKPALFSIEADLCFLVILTHLFIHLSFSADEGYKAVHSLCCECNDQVSFSRTLV